MKGKESKEKKEERSPELEKEEVKGEKSVEEKSGLKQDEEDYGEEEERGAGILPSDRNLLGNVGCGG